MEYHVRTKSQVDCDRVLYHLCLGWHATVQRTSPSIPHVSNLRMNTRLHSNEVCGAIGISSPSSTAATGHNHIPFTLQGANDQLALCRLKNPPRPKPPRSPAHEQILDALDNAESPLVFSKLQKACRMRTETFCKLLAEMQQQGKLIKTPYGYQLVSKPTSVSLSRSL